MMNAPQVSIIVPIYKVEAMLERCLDSIIGQRYQPLEVILVNDGSPDGCGEIIRRYEKRWPFIQSVWQDNSGLGAARNAGIEKATGKYLAFIDSDDYVEPDYISHLVELAERRDADVVVCNFYFNFPNSLKVPFPLMTIRKQVSGNDAARISLKLLSIPTFAWNKLYKTALFKIPGVQFPSIYYEDIATMSRVLVHARIVAITRKPLYHYCLRKTGITGNFKYKNIDDFLKAVDIIRHFIWDEGLWDAWIRPYRRFLRTVETQLFFEVNMKMSAYPLYERQQIILHIHRKIQMLGKPPLPVQVCVQSHATNLTA